MWQGVIAVLLIASFVAIAGVIAYQLYGPGIRFDLPDYLLPAGWATSTGEVMKNDPLAEFRGILFQCVNSKALKAEIADGALNLTLSDGRQIRLTAVASTDEERYANADGSFTFWRRGISASVEEQGTVTYASCLQQ